MTQKKMHENLVHLFCCFDEVAAKFSRQLLRRKFVRDEEKQENARAFATRK